MWLLYYVKNHVSSVYGGDGYERYGGYIYIYICILHLAIMMTLKIVRYYTMEQNMENIKQKLIVGSNRLIS